MPELILASTSRYRRELLARLKVPFRCVAPEVDEAAFQAQAAAAGAEQLALDLARLKAISVAARHPTTVVLASDQVCVCEERILSKPGNAERAIEQLQFLAGKAHQLITAVCIVCEKDACLFRDITHLKMRALKSAEIARYVAADEPLDCAGSYKLECLGISLFDSIQSDDHTAITGLPLLLVSQHLRKLGFDLP